MEGSTGKLFNHRYQDGVNVVVTNVNLEYDKITFRTTDDPDVFEEFDLYLNDRQNQKNEVELNADEKKYFIEWVIELQNNEPDTPVPGNVSNNNNNGGGRYKTRNMRKNKRTKKSKKTKRIKKVRKSFKH